MRAVLDTNVLIYDTFEDSMYHEEARITLDKLKEWIVPVMVIHEYVWFMKSLDANLKSILEKTEEYLLHEKTKIVNERAEDIVNAINMVLSENLSLSRYNDKVILSIAIGLKTPLATFDGKLRRQTEKEGISVIPDIHI
jgi:hypothetical protein